MTEAQSPVESINAESGLADPRAWRLETDLVLIESYRQGADRAAFLDLFATAQGSILDRLAEGQDGVRFVGAIVIPGDEVVFYLVASRSLEQVKLLVEQARLATVRIVPASWASPLPTNG